MRGQGQSMPLGLNAGSRNFRCIHFGRDVLYGWVDVGLRSRTISETSRTQKIGSRRRRTMLP